MTFNRMTMAGIDFAAVEARIMQWLAVNYLCLWFAQLHGDVVEWVQDECHVTPRPYLSRQVLACPKCHTAHVDRGGWAAIPHKTHLCEWCGHTWRPFDFYTVGVAPEPCTCTCTPAQIDVGDSCEVCDPFNPDDYKEE